MSRTASSYQANKFRIDQPTNWCINEIQRRESEIHIRYRSNILPSQDSSRAEKLCEISMMEKWNVEKQNS